jgi:DNA-binding Lrp family transcriptional regulator
LKKDKDIHLVKKVSKELGMTYKELGEAIGYSEGTLRRAVSKNTLSAPLKKALELYLEIEKLKESKKKIEKTKELISSLLKEI